MITRVVCMNRQYSVTLMFNMVNIMCVLKVFTNDPNNRAHTARTVQRLFNTLSAHLTLSNSTRARDTWTSCTMDCCCCYSGGGWLHGQEECFTLARITRADVGLTIL